MKRLTKVPWHKLRGRYRLLSDAAAASETARRRRGSVSALPKRTPDRGGRPIRAGSYRSNPRSVRAIDQGVRADFVLGIRDIDLCGWPPFQRLGYIARPNAPCGTVSELHHMAPVVLLDLHRRSPCDRIRALYVSGSMYQGRTDASHPARVLE